MKRLTLLLACSLAMAVAQPAAAVPLLFNAVLTGPAEAPPNASPGVGTALVTIDPVALTMRVEASFSGLLAGVTASHIHCCTAAAGTGTAGVATVTPTFTGFPSGVALGSYDRTFDMTLTGSYNASFIANNGGTPLSAFNVLLTRMEGGRTYFNIHTTQFPGGEIRGFLQPVPEPSTLVLIGMGLAGIGARRKRRPLP